MEKIKSWKIITEQGKKIKKILKRVSKSNKLDIKISGLDACPSYLISSDNWLSYKTFITQELLKKNILGGNTTYLSISHTDKILDKYEKELNKVFIKISKIMKLDDKPENHLDGPVCHSSFKRLN